MRDIAGYQCFQKDRNTGKGGGVLIYIKDKFECHTVKLKTTLECLALNVILSPTMNFNIAVLYNPPSHNISFYDELSIVAKPLDFYKETMWLGDFNINWSDKSSKQKLKTNMTKFYYLQMIKGPTRITKQTKTLIDMAFTNKPERIIKMYNLITGLSDHMTLTVRKLTRKWLQYFGRSDCDKIKCIIAGAKTVQFERELKLGADHGCG